MRKLFALLLAALLTAGLVAAPSANATTVIWQQPWDNYFHATNPTQPCCQVAYSNRSPTWSVGSYSLGAQMIFQSDGNLVVYGRCVNGTWCARWSSGTAGIPRPAKMYLQGDGNYVIYDYYGRARWATGTLGGDSTTHIAYVRSDYGHCFEIRNGAYQVIWYTPVGC